MKCTCFLLVLACYQVASQDYVSPCPRLFTYEPGHEPGMWYGLITLLHDSDLNGVWLRVNFDRPIIRLGNWFGETAKRGRSDYLIKNPQFVLKAHTPKVVRFFVKYNELERPPRLVQFRLNAKVVCPELPQTTTTTTTERLFLSEADPDGLTMDSYKPETTFQPGVLDSGFETTTSFPETEPPRTAVSQERLEDVCGTVTTYKRARHNAGQTAYKGEFPWHGMLYYTKDITIAYLCGAALISRHHLVTVAHCVVKNQSKIPINPARLVVYLGKYYSKSWAREDSQMRYVENIIPHRDYDAETYDNDVALLKLFVPADITDYVRPICLWSSTLDFAALSNIRGTVVGWGFTEKGHIADRLMYVQMRVREDETCNKTIARHAQGLVSPNMFCAHFVEDNTECVGDSGGALVFPALKGGRTVWMLRGLVTISVVLQRNLMCGPTRYVVFSDVAKFHRWINQNVDLSLV